MNAAETGLDRIPKSHDALLAYLNKEARQHRQAARLKSLVSHVLFWAAIIATFVTTVNISAKWFVDQGLTAVLTALPGAVLLITNTFKYPSAANWHRAKARKLESLLFRLQFEDLTAKAAVAELVEALQKLDEVRVNVEAPALK